ncbi:MAG: restriction endonuclease [Candidatus Sumerlaeia bacterium]|nr:restriction endonuclease [Candidatus Sumerlaeia bacterium]
MAVPDFQSLMLPLLKLASDGGEHTLGEARERLAEQFQLTAAERAEMLPSGRQRTYDNRVAWAKSYLQQAGLVESPRRGCFRITQRGRGILAEGLSRIDIRLLQRFPDFAETRSSHARRAAEVKRQPGHRVEEEDFETPEETLESAYQAVRSALRGELLEKMKQGSPAAFERLVVELLLKMGYGGSRREAGEALGRAGDEGIDGIIREDRLGLDVIYLQAKRWEGTVGRPEIQRFVGALHGKRARKGVFITTSEFTADARAFVTNIEAKVALIDGRALTDLMIDHGLGVTTDAIYEIKRIDSDYFAED